MAPQSWKEWTRTGVLQAFIVAFRAEMFPLTIYFLARFYGLALAWTKGGNLWAPMIAAAAMSFSSVSVIGNAPRLRRAHV